MQRGGICTAGQAQQASCYEKYGDRVRQAGRPRETQAAGRRWCRWWQQVKAKRQVPVPLWQPRQIAGVAGKRCGTQAVQASNAGRQ